MDAPDGRLDCVEEVAKAEGICGLEGWREDVVDVQADVTPYVLR